MDRLDAMNVLLAVAESGSFSKASRQLGLPLATVSRNVAQLETHLKANLLIRSPKGLELTPAGRSYLTSIKGILEQLTAAERAAAGEYAEPKGDLIITAPVMFGRLHALPVVEGFLSLFPHVSVGLVLTDRVTHLLEDQIDVALRIGDLPDSSLIATRLGSVRRVTCGCPTYLANHGVPLHPEDISQHSVVSFSSVSSAGTLMFQKEGNEVLIPFRSRLSVNTIDAAIDAALSGFGLVRTLSYQVAEYVKEGRLATVLESYEPPEKPVYLIYDRQKRLPVKLRAFVDYAVPTLRDRVELARLDVASSAERPEIAG